jgi:hypothetical protein
VGEVIELLPDLEGDLDIAWRLAYVMLVDESAAADAARQAFAHTVGNDSIEDADRIHLLATTMRLTADRAGEGPDVDRPLVSAFWRLPVDQRAALWLSAVERLEDTELAEVLGVSPTNASHLASEAKDWIEVVMEGTSGPLCPQETNLADYLQGGMGASRAAALRRHIRTCPTCRSRVESYEEFADLKDVLRNALPDAPETLTTGALDEFNEEDGYPVIDLDDPRRPALPIPVRWLAGCCAGLLLLGFVGLGVIHRASSSGGTAHNVPSVSTTLPGNEPTTTAPPASTPNAPAPPVTFPTAPQH